MNNAEQFFNDISDTYKTKYSRSNLFHYYFFTERLEKATQNSDFNGKKILDIGAGTGDLYDYIVQKAANVTYSATDIAEGMLKHSNIPSENQRLGDYSTLQLPYNDYDYVFMLGVSTYLSEIQMKEYLNFIFRHANNNGAITISFTNKYCFDNFFRKLLKPFISLIPNRRNVLSQEIKIKTYSPSEVEALFGNQFVIENTAWLNHTIFPFNLLFKKPSVYLAQKIDKIKSPLLLSLFSSDFIIKARKNMNA